ncbi:hypothetical protein [Cypionkella sinensis]|uniref:Uncharacterized protein n=1 Tax=Cypionkella sinensis TaxID=1756043 RepID=A0ABV7J1J7_9RHOB
MFARVSDHETARRFHSLSDAERLERLRVAAEKISLMHSRGELTAEQAAEELSKLTIAGSNGFLRLFGL